MPETSEQSATKLPPSAEPANLPAAPATKSPKAPSQPAPSGSAMSKKARQLADLERLGVLRHKELNNLTAAMREREEAHAPAQTMIKNIQEREIQDQVERGAIL